MIKIIVDYVDGSMNEWDETESIIENLFHLEGNGYKDKTLINELITDDWGCPPKFITIKGTYKNKEFNKVLGYE